MTAGSPNPSQDASRPPPWLSRPIAELARAASAGRFPHALLIHESPGAGGLWLAHWIARLLLCTTAGERPCGTCEGCARVEGRRHPDLLAVEPIEDSRQIRIEQVRELARELALTSHGGGWKVAILAPADAMNVYAANALLKTLEEPAPRTLLVLVATQLSRLPATVASRCRRVRLVAPEPAACIAWLEANAGRGRWSDAVAVLGPAPFLLAQLDPAQLERVREDCERTLAQAAGGALDAAATAERWARADYELRLRCLENWLTDRIRARIAATPHARELRSSPHLSGGHPDLNIRRLFELLEETRELRALAETPLNRGLALERLLLGFSAVRPRA